MDNLRRIFYTKQELEDNATVVTDVSELIGKKILRLYIPYMPQAAASSATYRSTITQSLGQLYTDQNESSTSVVSRVKNGQLKYFQTSVAPTDSAYYTNYGKLCIYAYSRYTSDSYNYQYRPLAIKATSSNTTTASTLPENNENWTGFLVSAGSVKSMKTGSTSGMSAGIASIHEALGYPYICLDFSNFVGYSNTQYAYFKFEAISGTSLEICPLYYEEYTG